MRRSVYVALLLIATASFLSAEVPGIGQKTAGTEKYPGYFNFYWDAGSGKIWLEIDKFDTEFLYLSSLPAGIGSNAS